MPRLLLIFSIFSLLACDSDDFDQRVRDSRLSTIQNDGTGSHLETSASPDVATPNHLLGSWQIVDQRLAGPEIVWTFDESFIVVSTGPGAIISQSNYTIDKSHWPHRIMMQINDDTTENRPGIYSITGDQLQLSFSVDGGPRPVDFYEGQPIVLERVPRLDHALILGPTEEWLMGTWISDRALTHAHMVEDTSMAAETARRVADTFFGWCEVTYSNSKVNVHFPPDRPLGHYEMEYDLEVLHASGDQIVLNVPVEGGGFYGVNDRMVAMILNFIDEDTYWVYSVAPSGAGLHVREYFSRKQ